MNSNRPMNVYLAGPDVFRSNAAAFFHDLKSLCLRYGMVGLSPFDAEIKELNALQIFQSNISLIDKADAVIANLQPFRGVGVDDGTSFEIGYAYSRHKIIFGYTPFHQLHYKELAGRNDHFYDADFPVLEDFNQPCNLMIVEAIRERKGEILASLEDCLKMLVEHKNN